MARDGGVVVAPGELTYGTATVLAGQYLGDAAVAAGGYDLRNATAFIVPLGGAHVGETVAALRRAAPYLRGLVAHGLRLKYAPNLSFQADTSFDEADRIGQLLRSPQVARDLHHEDDDEDDEEDNRGA